MLNYKVLFTNKAKIKFVVNQPLKRMTLVPNN